MPEDIAGDEAPDLLPVPPHPIEIPVANPAALDRAAAMILDAEGAADHVGSGGEPAADRFADWGLTFGNPDFVKYAESYGAKGSRVETAGGLFPALEAAFEMGGVHLVAVPVDYSENKRVLIDELRKRVPAAAIA